MEGWAQVEELWGQQEGRGNGTFSTAAQEPWSSFSGLSQETLKRAHPDRIQDLPPSLHILAEDYVLLKPTCRILQIAHGFVTCGNYTQVILQTSLLSGDWSQEDCRPKWELIPWLPSFPDWTSQGGQPFWTWHSAAGLSARCPGDTLSCHLHSFSSS